MDMTIFQHMEALNLKLYRVSAVALSRDGCLLVSLHLQNNLTSPRQKIE